MTRTKRKWHQFFLRKYRVCLWHMKFEKVVQTSKRCLGRDTKVKHQCKGNKWKSKDLLIWLRTDEKLFKMLAPGLPTGTGRK